MNDNDVVMSQSDAVMVIDAAKHYEEMRSVETFVPVLVMQHQCVELPAYRTEAEARSRLASAAEFNGLVGFVAQTTTRIVPARPAVAKGFTASIAIDDEKILNALETGGWSYWGFFVDRHMMWSELINEGKSVLIGTADGDEITIDRDAIRRGLAAMISDQPERLVEIVHDECDSEACDVLVQYACFGEVRYS